MELLVLVYLFVLGAAMGSFAGAMAWRIHARRDIVRERSECEQCHHVLSWRDLVPVISWLALQGRCRYCRSPIGYTALLLELSLGMAFVASFIVWPYGFDILGLSAFIAWLVALVMLTILFVYDVRHYLLPDVITWPLAVIGGVIGVMILLIGNVPFAQWPSEVILSLLPVSGVYALLYLVSNGKWVGLGDVKLGIFIGLALGWQNATLALLLANYLGFFWILPKLLRGKLDRTSRMPFGPFLIIASFIAFLWGSELTDWFLKFLMS